MDEIDLDALPEWDAADYLSTPMLQAEYLSLVLDEGDDAEIVCALSAIARARAKAGLAGDASDKDDDSTASRDDGAITVSQALSVVKALGLKLKVRPADAA